MDKPFYLGFAVLELSKLLMYETYYDKLQPYDLFCNKNKKVIGKLKLKLLKIFGLMNLFV